MENSDKSLELRSEATPLDNGSLNEGKTNYVQLDDGEKPRACNIFSRWIILEPTIFLFLASARMVYFTRQNLFIHVVCRHTNNLTEDECGNLTQVGNVES